ASFHFGGAASILSKTLSGDKNLTIVSYYSQPTGNAAKKNSISDTIKVRKTYISNFGTSRVSIIKKTEYKNDVNRNYRATTVVQRLRTRTRNKQYNYYYL